MRWRISDATRDEWFLGGCFIALVIFVIAIMAVPDGKTAAWCDACDRQVRSREFHKVGGVTLCNQHWAERAIRLHQ